MSPAVSRTLRAVVTVAIVALLVLFARKVDWAQTWAAMRAATLSLLLLAAVVNLVSLGVKGVRWWLFLRPLGITSIGLAVRATCAGAGLNNVLVANGGDAARVVFVSRTARVPASAVLASLALERMFDAVGFVVILVAAAVFLPDLPPAMARYRVVAELLLLVIAVGLVLLARYKPVETASAVIQADVPLPWHGRLRRWLGRFGRSVAGLSTGPRFAGALGLSMIAWACQAAVFALTASAAHAPLPLAGNLAALLATNAGLLVRATPGNVGVFQAAYSLTAQAFDVSGSVAVATAFLIQALQIIPTTLVGVLLAPEFVFRKERRAPVPEP